MQNKRTARFGRKIFFPALVALVILMLFVTIQSSAFSTNRRQGVDPVPIGPRGTWDLIFNDDFEGSTLDPNKWTTCYWWEYQGCTNAGNSELQWYQPQNVFVQDGSLHLVAKRETVASPSGNQYNYTSGMVTTGRSTSNVETPVRFAFEHGFAEIRVRLPKGRGLWPAFWLLPSSHASRPEIDVMELLGHKPDTIYMVYHYLDEQGRRHSSPREWTGSDFTDEWHTFGVEWKEDAIIWFIDGTERRAFTDRAVISSESMYLLLNLAVGGDWPGAPDENTPFPSTYEIDYVRVWKAGGDVSLRPVADTYIDASQPEDNFGAENLVMVDSSPPRTALLKFDLSGLAGKQLRSAWLRIKTTREIDSGSENGQTVHLVDENGWDESAALYGDNFIFRSEWLGVLDNTEPNIIYEIPLDLSTIQARAGGILTIAIENHGDDGLNFYSREFQTVFPELILKFDR